MIRHSSINIDISGLSDLKNRLRSLRGNQFVELAQTVCMEIGKELLTEVKEGTPVDTGYLQQQWKLRRYGVGAIVYNPTYYASYVSYGHRLLPRDTYIPAIGGKLKQLYVPPNKYVEKAVANVESQIEDIASKVLERELERYLNGR